MNTRRLELAIVAASAAVLALLVLSRKKAVPSADAYPFPTQRSHAVAPVEDEAELAVLAGELEAEPAAIREAAAVVGRSRAAIADYLKRQ